MPRSRGPDPGEGAGALWRVHSAPEIAYKRSMTHTLISIDPDIMGGKACIAGTRVPVHILLGHLGSGATVADLLEAYPFLTDADIHAAIAYAADLVEHEGVVAA